MNTAEPTPLRDLITGVELTFRQIEIWLGLRNDLSNAFNDAEMVVTYEQSEHNRDKTGQQLDRVWQMNIADPGFWEREKLRMVKFAMAHDSVADARLADDGFVEVVFRNDSLHMFRVDCWTALREMLGY